MTRDKKMSYQRYEFKLPKKSQAYSPEVQPTSPEREWLKAEKFPDATIGVPTDEGFSEGYRLSEILKLHRRHVLADATKYAMTKDRTTGDWRCYCESCCSLRDMKEK